MEKLILIGLLAVSSILGIAGIILDEKNKSQDLDKEALVCSLLWASLICFGAAGYLLYSNQIIRFN